LKPTPAWLSAAAASRPLVIVVDHDSGYAGGRCVRTSRSVERAAGRFRRNGPRKLRFNIPDLKITLQSWGRGIGILRAGTSRLPARDFDWADYPLIPVRQAPIRATHEVETDAAGKFIVLRLTLLAAPGVSDVLPVSEGPYDLPLGGLLTHFDVPAGGLVRLELISPGNTLVGRIAAPDGSPGKLMV